MTATRKAVGRRCCTRRRMHLSIRLTATSQQSKYDGTNTVDVNPETLEPVHGDLTQERVVSEPSEFKYENYNALINWNTGPFTVLSTTSYGILNSDVVSDATAILAAPGLTDGEALGGIGVYEDNDAKLEKFTQEIRLCIAVVGQARMAGGRLLHPRPTSWCCWAPAASSARWDTGPLPPARSCRRPSRSGRRSPRSPLL